VPEHLGCKAAVRRPCVDLDGHTESRRDGKLVPQQQSLATLIDTDVESNHCAVGGEGAGSDGRDYSVA